MKQKIVSIVIAVIALVACVFAVIFAMRYDDSKTALYKYVAMIQEKNPGLITSFDKLTQVSEVPQFVATQREELAKLDKKNNELKLQKDILYTYMEMVSEVNDSTFQAFQANYKQLENTLLAQYTDKDVIAKSYANVKTAADLNTHFLDLKEPYNKVKQEYLANKEYLKAAHAFVNMADQSTQAVSEKKQVEEFQAFQSDVEALNSWNSNINLAVILTYIIGGLSILAMIVFSVYHLAFNLKAATKTLIILLGAVVVVLVSYFIASPDLSPVAIKAQITPGISKMVSTGMILIYITFIGAILAIVWASISAIIKKMK